jgi:hypothetical protein
MIEFLMFLSQKDFKVILCIKDHHHKLTMIFSCNKNYIKD